MTANETYRVNLFPNPNFNPDGATKSPWGTDFSHLMTGDGTVNAFGNEVTIKVPELIPGESYVFTVKCDTGSGYSILWADTATQLSGRGSPDGDGLITIRFTYPESITDSESNRVVLTGGTFSEPQLELASTYDAAVAGGASVLRLGHHAETITNVVGRVMPDDANRESLSVRPCGAEAWRVERYGITGRGRDPLDVHAQRGRDERDRHVRYHGHRGARDRHHDGQPGFLQERRGELHGFADERRICGGRGQKRQHEIDIVAERAGHGPRRSGLRVRDRVESGQNVVRGGGDSLAVRQLGLDAATLTPVRGLLLSVGGDAR